jgi:hypothetical protein
MVEAHRLTKVGVVVHQLYWSARPFQLTMPMCPQFLKRKPLQAGLEG